MGKNTTNFNIFDCVLIKIEVISVASDRKTKESISQSRKKWASKNKIEENRYNVVLRPHFWL